MDIGLGIWRGRGGGGRRQITKLRICTSQCKSGNGRQFTHIPTEITEFTSFLVYFVDTPGGGGWGGIPPETPRMSIPFPRGIAEDHQNA